MNRLHTGWVVSALLSVIVLVACDGDAPSVVTGEPPGGDAACVPGELTRPDGSCQPAGLPPDMACPPGERALPTSAGGSCQAAGVPPEACAAGRFVPDGRGGCEAILPEEACAPGQMAVPGESSCRDVGPCGAPPWGAIPVDTTTGYVDQGYLGSDSDGSRERPWKTVQEGVDAASPGAIVAVAKGRYAEDVLVANKPVRLWGRCPTLTEVVGLGAQQGAITVASERASGSEVRGLAVTGPSAGVVVRDARSVTLEEVWVHHAGYIGVYLGDRAGATLRGALLEQNHTMGVVIGGSEATIEATVVRATQPDDAQRFGRGIDVEADSDAGQGAKLSLTASLVEDNHEDGVFVVGAEVVVEATVVRATQPNGAGRFGRGIDVYATLDTGAVGKLWLTASLIEENRDIGVAVLGSEATVEATVVRATQPNGTGEKGTGISVQADPETGTGATLSLAASLIEQNHDVGVLVAGAEATIVATVARATQPDSAGRIGHGIAVQPTTAMGEGGKLWLTASLIEENHGAGVTVFGSEATIEATVVRATQPNDTGEPGMGIGVQKDPSTGERGKLWLTASLVEQNHALGVFIVASEATIETTVVRATQPDEAGTFGRGVDVQADLSTGERAKLSLAASLVEDNHDVGVFVAGSEATIVATAVRATKQAPAGSEFGDGILVVEYLGESRATIAATALTDNARAGVMYVGSAGELSGGRSSGNRFGLVLQSGTSGAQPTLGEGNAFEGNTERDRITNGDLQVPDTAAPLP